MTLRRVVWLVAGLCLAAGTANAQLIPSTGVCGTLTMRDEVGGGISFGYTIPAKFPQPAQYKSFEGKFNFQCGKARVVSDGSTVTITSTGTLMDAWRVLDANNVGFIIDEYGYYDYPALRMDYHHFELRLFYLNGTWVTRVDGGTFRNIIGYKANGGRLNAIAFEGNHYPLKLSASQTLDIYVKPEFMGDDTIFQRLSINPAKKTITIYRMFTFPN